MNIKTWDDLKNAVGQQNTPQAKFGTFTSGCADLLDNYGSDPSRLKEIVSHIRKDGQDLVFGGNAGHGSGGGSR